MRTWLRLAVLCVSVSMAMPAFAQDKTIEERLQRLEREFQLDGSMQQRISGIDTAVSAKRPSSRAEARCECGQLMAKLRHNGIELKCKRCRRIVLLPFSGIEGWPATTP